MIGQTWKSEIRTFDDPKTGREVRQLTSTGNNHHLYFTENSFDANKNEIIFLSDRASGEDKAPQARPAPAKVAVLMKLRRSVSKSISFFS